MTQRFFASGWYKVCNLVLYKALKATDHGAAIASVMLNAKVVIVMENIEDEVFQRAINLLRTIFPSFKALRFCNVKKPAMEKIYFLVHCAY